MVLHLAALPPELRALVATKCDEATTAQFALASRACALLLRQHLAFLLEAHRQAQRDAAARQLQQALEFALSTANLHAVNAMGGSRFAINLAAHGAQTRPSTATFTCMSVLRLHSALRPCFRQCAASSGFQNTLGFAPPPGLRS